MTPQAYIAGPYSHKDPRMIQLHVLGAIVAGQHAANCGFLPIIPHTMGPHHGVSWAEAMERCRALIRGLQPGRDILVALPTWAESRGAREEVALAVSLGVEVVQLHELRPVTSVTG